MKLQHILFCSALASSAAFAGSSAPVITPPPVAPTLGQWFVGGTYGHLNGVDMDQIDISKDIETTGDLDADMFTLHFGRDLDGSFLGCSMAAYLEVGWIDGSADYSAGKYVAGYYESAKWVQTANTDADVEIVPVTLNFKLERQLVGNLNVYGSAGIGVAFAQADVAGVDYADDTNFYAQASLGLLYNFNEHVEAYGGARYVHLNSLDLGLEDTITWEIGLRYNF